MNNWDDLQLVEHIAREGSLAAAARSLEVDYSTVFRRLTALEKRLQTRLFERSRRACQPTPAGERLAEAAASAREAVDSALLDIAGADKRLSGTIRVTTIPSFAELVLIPLLARFRQRYPAITLEIVQSVALYNLSEREADVAIRFTPKPPDNLVGHRLGLVSNAVYASAEYLQKHPGASLSDMDWIVPVGEALSASEAEWHRKNVPEGKVAIRVNSGMAASRAAAQHMGLAMLVSYLGDAAGLVRVSQPVDRICPELWLLTHPHLRQVARIRAFLDAMKIELRALMPALGGLSSPQQLLPMRPGEEPG